ncbi:RNA-directed DNA polymerase [Novosphingobium sp. AAP1]|uniref:RNA-directed DNA polymerase n=1 Tax=Novosphingobium sp. AAP1 TaxID=1523413 RepID=UPI0006B99BA2|nr:RNA-directed DNA polymerase [Novosphingobium sp. AAP1]
MTWFDLLLLPENLLWAWRKAKRAYRMADSLYDQAEVAAFELDLEAQLESIRSDFAAGIWKSAPLRLVPQPKKPDKNGHPRLRQYFQVAVRDQVAWCALANVLGPELDQKMPAWSYGNRLYRAAWYEREDHEARPSRLNIGPYRHSAGHLYRHFKHSWPLFRRHVSLTARKMVTEKIDPDVLDQGERQALEQSDGLAYLERGHWVRPEKASETIYAASFDLKKFYPSIRMSAIKRGFETLVEGYSEDPRLRALIEQMLAFKVDASGLSMAMLAAVDPVVSSGPFDGLPTGLFASGFLANVAMLPLDLDLDAQLLTRRDIAHFRFVDDHEVLAYDFDAIIKWIADYMGLLRKHGIGAEIEPDKFLPKELKGILFPELIDKSAVDDDLIEVARTAAAVNGRKPSQLMTRTLAQVSMLAGIDFDLLTDAARGQRLEQLEWLLLANIPEQEIRGDTRMAFAAARISTLTPALFRPSDKLLEALRKLQILKAVQPVDQSTKDGIKALNATIATLRKEESDNWRKLLNRHFGLLFEAFATHPDKARLFIRLFDFCRVTGFDGFSHITNWMRDHRSGDHKQLCCYLGSLALQNLSRHILNASVAVTRANLLHRERDAARNFLKNVARAKLGAFVIRPSPKDPLQHFQADAQRAVTAALVIAGLEIADEESELSKAMYECAASSGTRAGPQAIFDLNRVTGVSLGIWYHWFFMTTLAHGDATPRYWGLVADALDPADPDDWRCLRRYPSALSTQAWKWLGEHPTILHADDTGWLLDAARSAPAAFEQLPPGTPIVDDVRVRTNALAAQPTLRDWVTFTNSLKPNDPRRSEWTALEILRQILKPLFDFDDLDLDGRDPEFLDVLHPENVQIPRNWTAMAADALVEGTPTWEGWRKYVHDPMHSVHMVDFGLLDYRYREILPKNDRGWPRRLRPIGQLLWGLLRRSFDLPAAWNIRGQERGLMEIVARDLEKLPISSFTLSILQSCLLPRNRETSLLALFPSLFGTQHRAAADDTEFDRPIRSAQQLDRLLERAQSMLQLTQMTVLEHQPRQLIPVRLRQLGAFEGDAGQAEDLL